MKQQVWSHDADGVVDTADLSHAGELGRHKAGRATVLETTY